MQDITHKNLEADLVNASLAQPVLLDIWAPWCGPCKTLGPTLEKLETAYGGRFKLVKLNADDEPEIAQQLSQMFGVRSIPFCVLFKGGQPVDGFVGALPEAEVRKFLDKHVPSAEEQASDEDHQAAEEALAEGDTDAALDRLAGRARHQPRERHRALRLPPRAAARRPRRRGARRVRPGREPSAARRRASPRRGNGSRRWKRRRRHARATRCRPRSPPTSATSTPDSSLRRAISPRAR
jgi:putative thioredoxin